MSAVCKPKVLLVDDEPVNIQLLSELLRDEGYEMFFATNGAQDSLETLLVRWKLL